jgi:hypothetical protein
MAFLDRVPADYLTLVETSLDYARAPELDDAGSRALQPISTYLLGLDILAHWLVFVMLLDGLWWIGQTGLWELELIISLVRAKSWGADVIEEEGAWWPEKMLKVRDANQHMYFDT